MLSSEDIRLVAAIARAGGLVLASKELRLDHSTVFRKLKNLEQKIGGALFNRVAGRYLATPAAEQITEVAEKWAVDIDALDRRISNQKSESAGLLRITTTEDVAIALLTPVISHLNKTFPALRTESVVDNRLMDLSRFEADIAIRPTRKPPDGLVGTDLGIIATAVYARRTKVQKLASRSPPEPWIMRVDSSGPLADRRWMEDHVSKELITATFSNFSSLLAAANAGLGLALLPCFVADQHAMLERRSPPIKGLTSHLWMLYHGRMRRDIRVQAFAKAAKSQMSRAINS